MRGPRRVAHPTPLGTPAGRYAARLQVREEERIRRQKVLVFLLVCAEEDRQKAVDAAELRAEYRDMGTNRPRASPIERERLSWTLILDADSVL